EPGRAVGEVPDDQRAGGNDGADAVDHRRHPRAAADLAVVSAHRRGAGRARTRRRRGAAGRRRREHGRQRRKDGRPSLLVAPSRSRPWKASGARGPARPRRTTRRAPGGADAHRLRGLRGAHPVRGGCPLTSAPRAVGRYLARYRVRYVLGAGCLFVATLASLGIPSTVKRAIEALQADAARASVGVLALEILLLAVVNGLARLGSRFAIIGGAQRIEYDVRNDLYRAFASFPPAVFAAHPTGDLMTRATSDVSAVKQLVGFGTVSVTGTLFAFVGALAAMLAVDPWLTLWAMLPYPVLIVMGTRFNATLHERTQAAQEQLSTLAGVVQERLAGMAVVRAYTMEASARSEFERANAEYLRRGLAVARVQARFAPLTGLVSGAGLLIVLWIGGRDVMDGRLTLGALVAFNGYLAYLAWPTLALGWTLGMFRRGFTSMERIQEMIATARPPEPVATPLAGPPAIRFADLTFAY